MLLEWKDVTVCPQQLKSKGFQERMLVTQYKKDINDSRTLGCIQKHGLKSLLSWNSVFGKHSHEGFWKHCVTFQKHLLGRINIKNKGNQAVLRNSAIN